VTCRNCPRPKRPSGTEELEGRAVAEINVDSEGNVSDVRLAQSTGHDRLDQAVIDTLRKWKYSKSEKGYLDKKAISFTVEGSAFDNKARELQRLAEKKEKERQALQLEQEKEKERQALQLEQQREQQKLQPIPTPDPSNIPQAPNQPITPEPENSPSELPSLPLEPAGTQ
jgi:TonB family protein